MDKFFEKIKEICKAQSFDINVARKLVSEINEFLYNTYDGIGTTPTLDGREEEYFSDFHKYWEKNHKEILNPTIDENQCELVCDELHNIYKKDKNVFSCVWNTYGLSKEEICKIRFLTANQDFRGSRNFGDLVKIYKSDNSIFDIQSIYDNPKSFVANIDVSGLAQDDKRINYARAIAKFCIDNNCEPFNLISKYNNNLIEFKNAILSLETSGYGNKKADMFLRDMVVLKVWNGTKGFDKINVASDVNTIKVALRTGILKTEIPLVSSFLDIFCYQYSYIDDMSANAWRKVWEKWVSKYPNDKILSPCLLDYFIYNVVGKQMCKEIVYEFEGEGCGHKFNWHSPRNKTCQVCYKENKIRNKAHIVSKKMPCEIDDASISINAIDFVQSNNKFDYLNNCPFKKICDANNCKRLNPPKSISIYQQTGWTTAYAKKGQGGGGLMS